MIIDGLSLVFISAVLDILQYNYLSCGIRAIYCTVLYTNTTSAQRNWSQTYCIEEARNSSNEFQTGPSCYLKSIPHDYLMKLLMIMPRVRKAVCLPHSWCLLYCYTVQQIVKINRNLIPTYVQTFN